MIQKLPLLLILLSLGALFGCQTTAPKIVNIENQFSEQDVTDILEVVIEELPRATGYKLSQKPQIRFLKKDEFAKEIGHGGRGKTEEHRFEDHKRFARSVAAVYRSNPPTILVAPEQIRFQVDDGGHSKNRAYNALLIVLTHELVHALQDEHVGLSNVISEGRAMGREWITTSMIEGHAELQTALVLHSMGLMSDPDEYLLAEADAEEKVVEQDPQLREYQKQLDAIYEHGKKFYAFHYRRSGNPYAWQVLTSKPPPESMLIKPETYTKQPPVEGTGK